MENGDRCRLDELVVFKDRSMEDNVKTLPFSRRQAGIDSWIMTLVAVFFFLNIALVNTTAIGKRGFFNAITVKHLHFITSHHINTRVGTTRDHEFHV